MKNCFSKLSLLCSLVIFTHLCNGQGIGNYLVFDQLTKKQGLPDNAVNISFQDSRGFLWLATNHGLSRYDGRSFKNYTTIGNQGISDIAITCITEDKAGNIWFGTESGLNKLDPKTEKINQYLEGRGPGSIPFKWCNYLFTDADKNTWLTTEKGLALYNPASDRFQNYPISVSGKDDRINKFIKKIADDGAGKLWLATSFGIKAFDKKTRTYTSYHKAEIDGKEQAENVFYSLFIDHNGSVWAGTFFGQLFKFNQTAGAFEPTTRETLIKYRYPINDISELKVQDKWYQLLATDGGLFVLPESEMSEPDESISLPAHVLTKIYTDRQSNLWITSADGLFKLNSNSFAFKWIPIEKTNKTSSRIFHIIPDIKEPGAFFYLTTQSGWYRYNAATQSIVPHQLPVDKDELLKNINNWMSDGSGYWFTSVRGFGYYDIYNNKLNDLSRHTFSASGQSITGYVVNATKTNYWVTLRRSGILVYNASTQADTVIFADRTKPDNTYGAAINDMQKGADANIWFTSSHKLYRVNPADYSYKTYLFPRSEEKVADSKLSPLGILFTKNGRVLVWSHLRIYEFRHEQLVTIYPANGFSHFSIERITEAKGNDLWVQTEATVFKTDSSFRHWDDMSNLPGWEDGTSITAVNASRPGEILFASDNKIGVLKEGFLQKTARPLSVLISRVRNGVTEHYLLSPGNNEIRSNYKDALEIDLSPVNFIAEKENKIMYRLRGWDPEWKELINTSTVRYEQLPPGDYSFETRSINADGLSSPITELYFIVTPPFYRSWWFILMVIVILAFGAFLLYRYNLKKALELEKLRTRIATDLHDDIGATLSSISLYSQAVKTQLTGDNKNLENVLDKMGETSREMVTSMSDIVWAINPDNDSFEKLIKRMENYATDMCALKNIRLHFSADEKLNTLVLPLEHRKNIYLIFKETINNAVKYSSAEKVMVDIILQHRNITMKIEDDGIGFEITKIIKGNGMKNIQSRAKEINGTLAIDSLEEKGTRVILKCSI